MPNFDFIAVKELRDSLTADAAEMAACMAGSSWKSTQVLAGSIVEAVLVDFLVSTSGPPTRPSKSPLQMDLKEAIEVCKAEGVLSERAADLCSVIRSYRNLIHPGRVIRLKESPPDANSASIAVSLVELIVADIAKARTSAVGSTAEQLVSKLERDQDALSIFKHLFLSSSEPQRERFLLDVLPGTYMADRHSEFSTPSTAKRLADAYRSAFELVSEEVKKKALRSFVGILREADGSYVVDYFDAFFLASDLEYLLPSERPIVIDYLLTRSKYLTSGTSLAAINGIAPFLQPSDAKAYVDFLVRSLFAPTTDEIKADVREVLLESLFSTPITFDEAFYERIDLWVSSYERRNLFDHANDLKALKEEIVPF